MIRATVALLSVLATAPAVSTAVAEPASVGFVNLTPDAAGQTAIASLRAGLRGRGGGDWRAAEVHPALERPRLPAAGVAPPPLDLDPARAAYRRFDTKAALAALESAEAERRHHSPGKKLYAQLAEIALLRGQVLADAGRKDEAKEAFAAVRTLSPDRELDPARYPPAIRELYDASAPKKGREVLTIEAPAGATVWVDGKKIGDAPLRPMKVPAGEHLVTVVLAGHRTESLWGSDEVLFDLEPLPARERVADLRDTLSASSLDLGVLGEIARAAKVDALVVITRREGALAAALYDRRANTLSSWSDPNPTLFGPSAGQPITAGPPDPSEDKPWFRTWWGIGIIGGAIALSAVTMVVVLDDDLSFALP